MPCRDKCESLANGGHSIIFYELGIGQFASTVLRVDVVSDTYQQILIFSAPGSFILLSVYVLNSSDYAELLW